MKETITERFNKFSSVSIGSIITLSKATRGMKYGKQKITDAFNKFVPKSEYSPEEKDSILEDLFFKTNFAEIAL